MEGEIQTGKNFVYGLFIIFGLLIIALVIIPVFKSNFYPVLDNYLDSSDIDDVDKDTIRSGWTNVKNIISIVLVILFVVTIIYLIVIALRREREEQYY